MTQAQELMERLTTLRDQADELIATMKRNPELDQRVIGLGATDLQNGFSTLIDGLQDSD